MNLIIKTNKLHVLSVCRFTFNINYLSEVSLYMCMPVVYNILWKIYYKQVERHVGKFCVLN